MTMSEGGALPGSGWIKSKTEKGETSMPIVTSGGLSGMLLTGSVYNPNPPEPIKIVVLAYQGSREFKRLELTIEEWNAFADWKAGQRQERKEKPREEPLFISERKFEL